MGRFYGHFDKLWSLIKLTCEFAHALLLDNDVQVSSPDWGLNSERF